MIAAEFQQSLLHMSPALCQARTGLCDRQQYSQPLELGSGLVFFRLGQTHRLGQYMHFDIACSMVLSAPWRTLQVHIAKPLFRQEAQSGHRGMKARRKHIPPLTERPDRRPCWGEPARQVSQPELAASLPHLFCMSVFLHSVVR